MLPWPVGRFRWLYTIVVPSALAIAMMFWVVSACAIAGSATPLPYVPVLNPLELTQALALMVTWAWWRRIEAGMSEDAPRLLLALLAFIALNVVVARTVHFYLNVPFELENLAGSSVVQTGISILWGVTAGVLMTMARRRLDRSIWLVGAGLLAALIVKLFVIDLGNIGTVARIVSFLATGVLILLIGYLAPAPPRSPSTREQTT